MMDRKGSARMRNDRVNHIAVRGLALLIAFGVPRAAAAADVVLLASNGIRPVLDEVLPQFEQSTKHKVLVRYDVAAELRRQIDAGQTFDLAILTASQLDAVMKSGLIVRDTRVALAQAPMAIAIRAGASRPDIRATPALVRALEEATTITYAREGAGGVYFTQLLQKLGLSEQIKGKLRPVGTGADASADVARGDAPAAQRDPAREGRRGPRPISCRRAGSHGHGRRDQRRSEAACCGDRARDVLEFAGRASGAGEEGHGTRHTLSALCALLKR
jgi:molybdate transport system substrate-binding protein